MSACAPLPRRSSRRLARRWLLAAGLAAALAACEPGTFPLHEDRAPPVVESEGSSTAKPTVHGAPPPISTSDASGTP
jgi:hypothetical protein